MVEPSGHDDGVTDEHALGEVVRREQLLLDPDLRSSGEDVSKLLHPDFVEFGKSGRAWTAASIIEALKGGPQVSGVGADFCAHALADDVVLLTYRMLGQQGSRRSSVWVRTVSGEWLLRFHQGTPSS